MKGGCLSRSQSSHDNPSALLPATLADFHPASGTLPNHLREPLLADLTHQPPSTDPSSRTPIARAEAAVQSMVRNATESASTTRGDQESDGGSDANDSSVS